MRTVIDQETKDDPCSIHYTDVKLFIVKYLRQMGPANL
jgi:hypothetical protein